MADDEKPADAPTCGAALTQHAAVPLRMAFVHEQAALAAELREATVRDEKLLASMQQS